MEELVCIVMFSILAYIIGGSIHIQNCNCEKGKGLWHFFGDGRDFRDGF